MLKKLSVRTSEQVGQCIDPHHLHPLLFYATTWTLIQRQPLEMRSLELSLHQSVCLASLAY